uniref:Uncharacterized protein n=2 Tax=Macrostomum lignano TaxID=282301 RepID=A0A1I8FU95_9PLAT
MCTSKPRTSSCTPMAGRRTISVERPGFFWMQR